MDVNQLENKEDSRKKGGGSSKEFAWIKILCWTEVVNRCTGLFTILFSSTV